MKDIHTLLDRANTFILKTLPELLAYRFDVRWKKDDSPVTQADILLEQRLGAWLAERLPGLTLIGEESYASEATTLPADGWVAVLDPIDGTENFCSGLVEWGVSLSLWRNGTHRGSLLALPELGAHLRTGQVVPYMRSRITGFSSSIVPAIADGIKEAGEARILGCAVYNLYNVTRGALARFVNPKGAHSWDLLAGVLLAREHGCDVWIDGKIYDGSFLAPDRKYRVDIQHRYDLHSR
jgi:myo-inositol-1(or 4)-monophosphatase